MASLILGNLGSSLLGPLGGFIGSAIGSYIDNMLFAPKPPDQKGPRIEDLQTLRADPGAPIPLVYGADRVPGIIVGCTELIETINKEKVGGKGGPTQTIITYTYHVDIDYMVSEGPILGIGRIWAEGNIVRGTRYEMVNSTKEHPENIGGMPYPAYYKLHYYEPDQIPWSLEPGYFPSYDDGSRYRTSPNRLEMRQISPAEASALLASGFDVGYWKDQRSGYYIPLYADHAYGVSDEGRGRPTVYSFADGSMPSSAGVIDPANSFAFPYKFVTVMELSDYLSPASLLKLDEGQGRIRYSFRTSVGDAEDSGVDVSFRTMNVYVDFYADGDNRDVDGSRYGSLISSLPVENYDHTGLTTVTASYGEYAVPPGTRFVKVSVDYACFFPIFCDTFTLDGGDLILSYVRSYEDDEPVTRDWPDYWNLYDAINDFSKRAVLQFEGVDNITVYHGTFDQHTDTTMQAALGQTYTGYVGRAHVVMDRLELADYGNRIPQFSFEVVQFDNMRVKKALVDMFNRSLVTSEYYDLDGLTKTGQEDHILGYTIASRTSFRAAMEGLLEAFRIDVAEIGNTLVFREKDRDTDWVIPYSDLDAQDAGVTSPGDKIEFSYRDKIEMPRSLTVRFKDVERNYQPNTAHFYRQQGPSVQESTTELAAVIVPSLAKRYARDKMRDLWLERVAVKFRLPHKYIYVASTDILLIDGEGARPDVRVKATNANRGNNGIIEVTGVLRELVAYRLAPGETDNTDMDGSTWNRRTSVNYDPVYTVMHLLDLPPLLETDGDLGLYIAVGGAFGWRGAAVYRSIDAGASYSVLDTTTDASILGTVRSAMPDGMEEVIDTTSEIEVLLHDDTDTLESVTLEQLYNGYNAAVIGNEVIQYQNAESLGDGLWKLTTLLRGRRGTGGQTTGHVAAERFVRLNPVAIIDLPELISRLNNEYLWKGVSFGSSQAVTDPVAFTHTGRRLQPLAPALIAASRDGSDNVTLTWSRSDRVWQNASDGSDIGFSESIFRFEIDVYDPTNTSVVRTIVVDNAETTAYSAAQQTADGYTPGDPVYVRVYQMSATVGRGVAGIARV